MKHPLMPLKIFCTESLGQNISNLIMGFDIEHLNSANAHLLLSKVIRDMEMPVLLGNNKVIGPLNTDTVVLNNRCRIMLRTPQVFEQVPKPRDTSQLSGEQDTQPLQ